MSETEAEEVLNQYTTDQTNYSVYDEESIMVLELPKTILSNPKYTISSNFELSGTDTTFIAGLYPYPVIEDTIVIMKTNQRSVTLAIQKAGNIVIDWGDGTRDKSGIIDVRTEREPLKIQMTTELWDTIAMVEQRVHSATYDPQWSQRHYWPECLDSTKDVYIYQHTYQNEQPHTITCLGDSSALILLESYRNGMSFIDVSRNKALKYLICIGNYLKELDVSKNKLLKYLDCSDYTLSYIDVSNNRELETLYSNGSLLSSIDLSNNIKLKTLSVFSYHLSRIDISQNKELQYLHYDGKADFIDVSKNLKLSFLAYGNSITTIDVSRNPELTYLFCGENVTSLDVSRNPKLEVLICSPKNFLLDLSHNPALIKLWCELGNLSSLDLRQNTKLQELRCSANKLTTLDLSQNKDLALLVCSNNQLKSLNLQNVHALKKLDVDGNYYLKELDLANKMNIEYIIASLDILHLANNIHLKEIDCGGAMSDQMYYDYFMQYNFFNSLPDRTNMETGVINYDIETLSSDLVLLCHSKNWSKGVSIKSPNFWQYP